jgi:hypothetical protein
MSTIDQSDFPYLPSFRNKGRLRTGVAPTGAGTQAATGISLAASINVSDRPVTGQGVMGMKTQALGAGRLVEDAAYYVGLLRKKIKDVNVLYLLISILLKVLPYSL